MVTKKISIIIPIYNGEKWISRCIDSVLDQKKINLKNVEILLLNDGSNDGSQDILQSYKESYPEIFTVIKQKNIGVANTRNKGVQIAKGEFIVLLDQDDWIDDDFLYNLYSAIKDSKWDVVYGGYKLVDTRGRIHKKVYPKDTIFGRYLLVPAWGKIHRTAFLRNKKIKFFDSKFGEDNVFTAEEIKNSSKIKMLQYCGYNNWFDNQDNVTNSKHKGLRKEDDIQNFLIKLFSVRKDYPELVLYDYYILRTCVYYLVFSGKNASHKRFIQVYGEIFHLIEGEIPQIYKNKYIWLPPKGEILKAHIAIVAFVIMHKMKLVNFFARVYCRVE